jgi:hypothetical protein
MFSEVSLSTISTRVAVSATQHLNQVFIVRRDLKADTIHEKNPGWGFSRNPSVLSDIV